MASLFDIDEIYPDDGDHPLRLPRRQVGNSPQGVAVTLLADYTLRTRVALPSAAIVALLGETGVTTAGARTAISRLARRGVLEGSRLGRRSSYRLSRAAAANLSAGGHWILASTTSTARVGRVLDDRRLLAAAGSQYAASGPAGATPVARLRAACTTVCGSRRRS